MRQAWSSVRCQWKRFSLYSAMLIQALLDERLGEKVAAAVEHEAAPGEARPVDDLQARQGQRQPRPAPAVEALEEQLAQRLHAVEKPGRPGGAQPDLAGADAQRIALVAEPLPLPRLDGEQDRGPRRPAADGEEGEAAPVSLLQRSFKIVQKPGGFPAIGFRGLRAGAEELRAGRENEAAAADRHLRAAAG